MKAAEITEEVEKGVLSTPGTKNGCYFKSINPKKKKKHKVNRTDYIF